MNKILRGDEVIVIAGKDKGKRGKVAQRKSADQLLVDGVNVVKKHVRPNPMKNEQGGIESKTLPVHQSNIAIFNPNTGKADRVGFKLEDGKKVRIYRSDGAEIKHTWSKA